MLVINNLTMRCTRRDRFTIWATGLLLVSFIVIWQAFALVPTSMRRDFFQKLNPNTFSVFEIDTFVTSMAKLTIVDIVSSDPENRINIRRRIVNMERNEIFVSEIELLVPKNTSEITDTRRLAVDYSKLNIAAQPLVSPAFATGSLSYRRNSKAKILIIGLGGSQMNNFLHHTFPMMDITVIELEKEMVDIARRYFGLSLDKNQRVIVMDGKQYLKEAAQKGMKFDAIYVDACPTRFPLEEEIMCPISVFLDKQTISNIKECLNPQGTVVVKMLLFVKNVTQAAEKVADDYRKALPHCTVMPMVSDLNRVLVCGNKDVEESRLTEESLSKGFSNFVYRLKLEPGFRPPV